MGWTYERGEHRKKHCWKYSHAGFRPSKRGLVGKCPRGIDDDEAQRLLDGGIEYYEDEGDPFPGIIYNVRDGVPYEAVPTQPGKSYHAYPWQGTMPERILVVLQERAEQSGHAKEFKRWLRSYSK